VPCAGRWVLWCFPGFAAAETRAWFGKSAAAPHLSSKDQKPQAFSVGLDTASYFAQTAAAAAAVHETALAPDTVCAILNAHRHDDPTEPAAERA
jgi:hypothetical protein